MTEVINTIRDVLAVFGGIFVASFLTLLTWWKANEWATNRRRATAANRWKATRHNAHPTKPERSGVGSRS